jgi:hypothetical protein
MVGPDSTLLAPLRSRTRIHVLATRFVRALHKTLSPEKKREQGMPGARCTRGLVCKLHKEMRTRAYRFSGGSPAFPAQWSYGLCRALPGERIRLVTVAAGLMGNRIRLDRCRHRQLGTSNGCRDHTVLPYAESAVVLRRLIAHELIALRHRFRADAARVHRIPSRVRDDRDTPLCGTGWLVI